MNSIKASNNRTPTRDNSTNVANNDDDIFSPIYERVLNIVGSDDNDLADIRRYRYLTDHVVDTGNQEPNGLHEDIKKDVLNNVSASKFKYEKQETKDMIKKYCDMYKTLRGNSKISSIIGKICGLIRSFYVANTESHNSEISSDDAANKHNNAESKYIEIAKDIVWYYTELLKQIYVISGPQIVENISLLSKTLNKQQEAKNQQVTSSIKSTDIIKSKVMSLSTLRSLLVGDAVSKFLSEAKTQHSSINYVAIKELLLSLQRKIDPLKGTDTEVTKKELLIRDLFYGFGVQNSAWELQESIGEKLSSFSTEFGTINVDGKNFKIINRGSELHVNCVFLSLKNGDHFDSQTTGRDVKEYILEGAKKLKESLKNEPKTKEDVKKLLVRCITCDLEEFLFNFTKTSVSNEIENILTTILKGLNIDEFLNEFEKYKPEMFINGADSIYQLLLAIGMGKQIVIVDKDNKISKIFDPEKGLLTGIDAELENKSDDAIYVCMILGHMMKLEQVVMVDNDTNKASINTEKENILSVINTKIFTEKEVFSATKQVIKDAYEHFIGDDGRKCGSNEFPQLHAAYDAINPQKREGTESQETNRKEDSDKQIAKLMSEALVEIAILRPLYWIDYAQKLGLNSSMLPILKEALTVYQDVLVKKINALDAKYNALETEGLPVPKENLINMAELRRLDLKVFNIQREIRDESNKLLAVEKFFR